MTKKLGFLGLFSLFLVALFGAPSLAGTVQLAQFDTANAPMGTHLVQGTPFPTCTVEGITVTCPAEAFQLAGVGNTNATATLNATYSAIIDCFNPGRNPNNPIESHTQSGTITSTSGLLSPRNGRLTIRPLEISPTTASFQGLATCPNPNWTPRVRSGSIQLLSFTYTVSFVGFDEPYITITGNDPPSAGEVTGTSGRGRSDHDWSGHRYVGW
jgi:hypothetical protein